MPRSLKKNILGKNHPDLVLTQKILTQIVIGAKRYQEAANVYRECLAVE